MPSIPCIGAYTLPRQPRRVSLLHHAEEGVAIVAVSYVPAQHTDVHEHASVCIPATHSLHEADRISGDTSSTAQSSARRKNASPAGRNYVTLLEFALPGNGATSTMPTGNNNANTNDVYSHRMRSNHHNSTMMSNGRAFVEGAMCMGAAVGAQTDTYSSSSSMPPLRVRHLTLPGNETVTAFTLSHRHHDRNVYVTVQCQRQVNRDMDGGIVSRNTMLDRDEAAQSGIAATPATSTRLYRRVRGEYEESSVDAAVSVAALIAAGAQEGRDGVEYELMPRTVEMASHNTATPSPLHSVSSVVAPWRCLTTLPVRLGGDAGAEMRNEADDALVVAAGAVNTCVSVYSDDSSDSIKGDEHKIYSTASVAVVQLVQISRTRAALRHSAALPALAPFAVRAVAALRSSPTRVILLCHNALVEVELQSGNTSSANVYSTNSNMSSRRIGGMMADVAAIKRVWRWTPHDPLTSCCVGEPLLYAGTASGAVIVWDMQHGIVCSNSDHANASHSINPFTSCGVAVAQPMAIIRSGDRVVQESLRRRMIQPSEDVMDPDEMGLLHTTWSSMSRLSQQPYHHGASGTTDDEEQLSDEDGMQAITGMYSSGAGELVTCGQDGSVVVWRCRRRQQKHAQQYHPALHDVVKDGTGSADVCNSARAALFPVACDWGVCGEGSGWVDMSGAENLVAVVGECGELRVYSIY